VNEQRLQTVLMGALTTAAVLLSVVLLHREFAPSRPVDVVSGPPVFLSDWKDWLLRGRVIGDSAAPIQVVVFSDLECPVCRGFDRTLREVRTKLPREMAVVFVHYPLQGHRFARPAARAAECAGTQGRFDAFIERVYDRQDSLGLKPWSQYASESGVQDTVAFSHCVIDTTSVPRIADGVNLARKLGLHGTPTVVVNGWRFAVAPDADGLLRAIQQIKEGKHPS